MITGMHTHLDTRIFSKSRREYLIHEIQIQNFSIFWADMQNS